MRGGEVEHHHSHARILNHCIEAGHFSGYGAQDRIATSQIDDGSLFFGDGELHEILQPVANGGLVEGVRPIVSSFEQGRVNRACSNIANTLYSVYEMVG